VLSAGIMSCVERSQPGPGIPTEALSGLGLATPGGRPSGSTPLEPTKADLVGRRSRRSNGDLPPSSPRRYFANGDQVPAGGPTTPPKATLELPREQIIVPGVNRRPSPHLADRHRVIERRRSKAGCGPLRVSSPSASGQLALGFGDRRSNPGRGDAQLSILQTRATFVATRSSREKRSCEDEDDRAA